MWSHLTNDRGGTCTLTIEAEIESLRKEQQTPLEVAQAYVRLSKG